MNCIRTKICCISSVEEAALAVRYGASALGLVSSMPSGPGVIPLDIIAGIVKTIPPGVASVLLTSCQNAEEIAEQQRYTSVNTLQVCDELPGEELINLKKLVPSVKIIQVIHVMDENSISEAIKAAGNADGLLLDSGNPGLQVKVLGGTGRTHNWDISRRICREVNKPVYLAGGLNPDNITEAIETVQPYGVDICSGLRTNAELDEKKLSEFMRKVFQFIIK
jgi:phosphoribosylanthranilate isomerase